MANQEIVPTSAFNFFFLAWLGLSERIVGYVIVGINLLLDKLECPIDVIIIPGNHGRTTRRPESKLYVLTNYDSLVGDFVELYYQSSKRKRRPKFYSPASGDALMSLFGWNFLITHGDRIGSRGGTGFGGPIYTIARGFKRLTQDYAARRIQLDYIICGHFHCSYKLDEGYSSGSLVGPSEFSRDRRMVPHPASQLFLRFQCVGRRALFLPASIAALTGRR